MDLYGIDKTLFLFLNSGLANSVFDTVMPFVTDADNWRIPLGAAWLALLLFGGRRGRIAALLAVVVLTLSDQVSSSLLKPLIGRVRPCFAVEGARLLIRQSRSFSFPSSHAANNAALALFFSVKYPRATWVFITIAVLVGYSRIYVGVHYPSDVAGGFLVGAACAAVVLQGERTATGLWRRFRRTRDTRAANEGESE
ncbi:phosphatase PAP2 family protein [bacterium]|nr:phosphatase PAP2 family protein [bacterium]